MIPALILPASLLGFISALVQLFVFRVSYLDAALTYGLVCAVAPAVILWLVKTAQMRQSGGDRLVLSSQ